jgi:hypothetical protein
MLTGQPTSVTGVGEMVGVWVGPRGVKVLVAVGGVGGEVGVNVQVLVDVGRGVSLQLSI